MIGTNLDAAVQQVRCKTLEENREMLADRLITLAARIEALKHGNYAWIGEFYGSPDGDSGFLEVFKNLVSRTSHEAAVKNALWKGKALCSAIDDYFLNPYNQIDAGIKLAREYFKVLIMNGIINDHE